MWSREICTWSVVATRCSPVDWWNGNNPKWPPFNETSFESLADIIQQAGVTKVTGGLIGDGSRYDDEFFAPAWAAADHVTQAGPIDALLANDSWQTPISAAKDPALGAAEVLRDMLERPRRRRRRRGDRCCTTGRRDDRGSAIAAVAGDPCGDAHDE